ncbi:MAG TPA: UDP-N-acetylmuramate dehydrogenase [Solirubrobacteraceae bacterium]|jgi:UDP-N-acetylmuramate dehydrogenase|nr:UDP-N-acetylmuramate dehydrogenase [Solirubrobacteraceae bacterium]
MSRFTTVRTGGPAEHFARTGQEQRLAELMRWATGEGLAVNVVGSGSNLLVADRGVPGLVVKLDGELAAIEAHGQTLQCGGGARLPAVSARAAQLGLTGIEFGVNIPGTVGGAVRMNANAYGGELARVLDWVEVAGADGLQRLGPDELGFDYRSSSLRPGQIVVRACFRLEACTPQEVKQTLATMRAQRRAAQPSGIKTFGSTFKNPRDERARGLTAGQLLARAGCGGLARGGARLSPKHANFVENDGTASTADVVAVMSEGRQRVLEQCEVALEPEVQVLGELIWPWAGKG